MTCPEVIWSTVTACVCALPASVENTHARSAALSNYLIQHGNFKKKKSMRLNFHIYIDLNYFGPRGLNKLQSGSRGVALFFSSFTGIWFNWYRGALQKRDGKNSLGHLAEDLTCSCSSGEKERERERWRERKKPAFPHSPGWVIQGWILKVPL